MSDRQGQLTGLKMFLRESLMIEGIDRWPTPEEVSATSAFLIEPSLGVDNVCALQKVYAPGKPLRTKPGMNVTVGGHIAPLGGPAIGYALGELCDRLDVSDDPWGEHVAFEKLHPFLDGNGRTGRAVWAWHMIELGRAPFSLPFLHRWYYQTLSAAQHD